MPNEDIITALRNAMEHGDNLASAKQIMINSGYNPQEVEEASTFLGGGVIETHQTTPQEQLTMPNQKPSLISKINPFKKKQVPPISSPLTPQTQPIPAIQQPVPQAQPLQQTRPIPAIQQPIVAQAQPAPAIQQPVPQAQPLQQQPITAQTLKQEITSQKTMPRTRQVNQQPMTSQRIQPPQLGRPSQFQKQLQQIKPKKPGHAKEIILLFVLLVLISLLITTIVLKDTILGWFS